MRITFILATLISAAMAALTVAWSVPVLVSGQAASFAYGPAVFSIDPLTAFMVVLINIGVLLGMLYGISYLKPYASKSFMEALVHALAMVALHGSMLAVTMVRDMVSLLIMWEIMSMSSFLLVLFEGEKARTRRVALSYFIQMHVGAFFLLLATMILAGKTGSYTFDAMGDFYAHSPSWMLFLPLFLGFGMKAGFLPLHTWLPHAHPAAPSHVSGIMSGVMIKLGIYGILRTILYLSGDQSMLGVAILTVGIVTGLYAILKAIVRNDLKRLLAYSSVENIGLLGISIGMAVLGTSIHNNVIATLGWTATLLHMVHHMLFKVVLFQSAGNIYAATHTRNLNELGGLMKRMPNTVTVFILGALAICGLPPMNGFVSEFLMYAASIEGMKNSGAYFSIVNFFVLITLCLIGGLAIIAFTKAIGVGMLGEPRTDHARDAVERPWFMRLPQQIAIGMMIVMAVLPQYMVAAMSAVIRTFIPQCDAVLASLAPTLTSLGIFNASLVGAVGLVLLLRNIATRAAMKRMGPTWGCGFTAADARLQYTSTTYADSTVQLISPVVRVHARMHAFSPADVFPHARAYHTDVVDVIEETMIEPPIAGIALLLRRLAVFHTGSMRTYILYAFVFIIAIAVVTIMGVI
ncbi:proton-conducting transporter membrane subunit [soil metagenome]